MHSLAPASGLRFALESPWKTRTSGNPYVLQIHDIMSFGFRTYTAVEALLKTRDFNLLVIRTCTKRSDKPSRMRSYKKHGGVGGVRAALAQPFRSVGAA